MKCYSPLLQYTDKDVANIVGKFDRKLDTLCKDVEIIRNWEREQHHFPLKLTDRQIVFFLNTNKFSIERTKEKLDMMFTIKSLLPEFFTLPTDDPLVLAHSKAYIQVPLPKLTENLNRLHISKVIDSDQITDITALYTYCLHMTELRVKFDFCNSIEFIIDFENISPKVLGVVSPMELKKISIVIEKVYSNRVAAMHLINIPSFGEAFINIWKMTMKKKIQDRIIVHKNLQSLQKYYAKDCLPKEFGGNLKSIIEIRDDWLQFIRDNKDYIENIQQVRVNESLRPTKLDNDEILGFHGNFRKLEVD